jgi:hypothetical protein
MKALVWGFHVQGLVIRERLLSSVQSAVYVAGVHVHGVHQAVFAVTLCISATSSASILNIVKKSLRSLTV